MKNTARRTVWIVHKSSHDYTGAERYGELSSLFDGTVNIFNVDRLLNKASELFAASAKPNDYLLLAGAPILNAIAMTLFLTAFGCVNVLIFDAKTRGYQRREQTLAQYVLAGADVSKRLIRKEKQPAHGGSAD